MNEERMCLQKKGQFSHPGQKGEELEHHSGSICARACIYIYYFFKWQEKVWTHFHTDVSPAGRHVEEGAHRPAAQTGTGQDRQQRHYEGEYTLKL